MNSAWDSMERATRAPHRRRLFSWKKDEVALQQQGEAYLKDKFYWDVPPAVISVSSNLVDNASSLKTPKPHRQPGPVPRPPTTALPSPPSLTSQTVTTTSYPSRRAYLALVEKYNKEASQIYSDWQPHCPNFKYLAIKLNKQQCKLLKDSPLAVLKLDKFDTKMKIVAMSSDDGKIKVRPQYTYFYMYIYPLVVMYFIYNSHSLALTVPD